MQGEGGGRESMHSSSVWDQGCFYGYLSSAGNVKSHVKHPARDLSTLEVLPKVCAFPFHLLFLVHLEAHPHLRPGSLYQPQPTEKPRHFCFLASGSPQPVSHGSSMNS